MARLDLVVSSGLFKHQTNGVASCDFSFGYSEDLPRTKIAFWQIVTGCGRLLSHNLVLMM
jgi:hypothetical protein